jgi:6-phosphogluconate dehydrogenase
VDVGIIGLGRMGSNMARRLHLGGHHVVAFNRTAERTREITGKGIDGAYSLQELAAMLPQPRVVISMLPAGEPTETMIAELVDVLSAGDTIVDGGNANFHDSKRRHAMLANRGLRFIDCGVSGGVWGLKNGFGIMVGGEPEAVEPLRPIFETLAPPGGFVHCGGPGSGHYVKMVHNGIEYGLLQAYAEGFEILHASEYTLDLEQIAKAWGNGTVIRSWLLELMALAFERHGSDLGEIEGFVADSGEGRWTVQEAIELNVPAPIITLSLLARLRSRQGESFAAKVVAALREQFGGHAVKLA